MDSEDPRSRGEFLFERAKHRDFLTLVDCIDGDPRANEIYAEANARYSTHLVWGRLVLNVPAQQWSFVEHSRFRTDGDVYARLLAAYNRQSAPVIQP